MPMAWQYRQKRDQYMVCAKTARQQEKDLPDKHSPYLKRMMSNYVAHARRMNWHALAQQRVEDRREFERKAGRM